MIAAALSHTRLDADQAVLFAEFRRLRALLSRAAGDDRADAQLRAAEEDAASARAALPDAGTVESLAATFGLSPFERDLLLLCAGVELDPKLGALCAATLPGTTGAQVTFALALAALDGGHWSALAPTRPLRHWRLIEVGEGDPLVTSPLRIDERILHRLAGINALDVRLAALLRRRAPGQLMAEPHRDVAGTVVQAWAAAEGPLAVIQLHGDDRDGQADVAAYAAEESGLSLHVLRSDDLPTTPAERIALATLWSRESALLGSALLIEVAAGSSARTLGDFVDAVAGPLFVAAREPVALRAASRSFVISKPSTTERLRMWRAALGPTADEVADLTVVAGQFRLSATGIARAALATRQEWGHGPASRGAGDGAGGPDGGDGAALGLSRLASRYLVHADLADLAQRIEPSATWKDLVLPPEPLGTLRDIASQVRLRSTVHDEWGFAAGGSRGLGISALFAGDSGTGKTMAAEVLAHDLGLALYRVDLSTVVSKYIGETEKNLRRLFDTAEDGGAILLFDEADALFGKRSDVKDSHDRYANIEVSYLLQRMESYRGLAILTTNMRSALDRSFQRRLRFVVSFPFPAAEQRAEIWRRVFPASTPVGSIDHHKLARLAVAGGSIRNIALGAAFHAARSGEAVEMAHLLSAARSEYAKLERSLSGADTRGWT